VFVGHALLAFALLLLVAEWREWPTERAFALALAAGAFAALPDVDVLYTVVAVDPTDVVAGMDVRPSEFWETANTVHRSMTHSLVVALVATAAFALWALARPELSATHDSTSSHRRLLAGVAATTSLGALVAVSLSVSGAAGAFVMAVFVLGGVALTEVSTTVLRLSPRDIATVAVLGLVSHPWGDMVTGSPPALLYPLDVTLISERVVLSGDPTLNLLGAFAIELSVALLATVAVAWRLDYPVRTLVGRRAALGVFYGVMATLIVPPTIERSYPFVFSILAVGTVCGISSSTWRKPRSLRQRYRRAGGREAALRVAMTGLIGILVALGSYTLVYLL
jgi:membrane-bound metal-dependent hydrolase YbcI (DUF457 family)